jgi:cytoskeletal protein RodZ
MASLGETLRRARTKRRIGLEEIARETRIDARYLSALEKNDLEQLPGGAFDRGYVRTYAGYLGLDTDAMVQAYDREIASLREAGKIPEAGDLVEEIRGSVGHRSLPSGASRWRWGLLAGAGLMLALLLGARLWYLLPERQPLGSTHRATTAQTPTREAGGDAEAPAPNTGEIRDVSPSPGNREMLPADPDELREGIDGPETTVHEAEEPDPGREPDEQAPSLVPRETAATEAPEAPPQLEVTDAAVGSAVVDLQLRGRGDRFAAGQTVYFWTRILGGSDGQPIRHVWRHEGRQVGYVPLELGGAHWRTYSRRELPEDRLGRWTVEVVDGGGRVLAKASFECVTAPAEVDEVAADGS